MALSNIFLLLTILICVAKQGALLVKERHHVAGNAGNSRDGGTLNLSF